MEEIQSHGGTGMFRRKLTIMLLVSILLTGCLTGCGTPAEETEQEREDTHLQTMEEDPDLSYEVPVSTPHILVNQLGYITESTKIAVFCGSQLPDQFEVIDADTGKTVYTGKLEKRELLDSDGDKIGYGDFSQVELPGKYYIEALLLGESYSFQIADNLYDDVLKEAVKQYYYNRCGSTLTEEFAGSRAHNACHTGYALLREDISVSMDVSGGWHQDENGSKDVVRAAENIGVLLLSYELFGDAFSDDMEIPESQNGIPDLLDEIRYETDWLMKMQNTKTGAVYAGVTVYASAQGKPSEIYVEPSSIEAVESFAMCLAGFSYLYQDYDRKYAATCLKAAERAWKYAVLNQSEDTQDPWRFAAAAELYRASGLQEFRRYLEKCLAEESQADQKEQDDVPYFFGNVTYLMTKQPVKREYCSERIVQLLQKVETLSAQMKKEPFYVQANEDQTNHSELLQKMLWMATVNHIITNYEYETIIENHLHYFMGRNKLSISYIDDVGIRNYKDYNESLGIMNQFDTDSRLIFMLGEIISNYE